jgi:DNA-binding CsgD family transcriptional regulator
MVKKLVHSKKINPFMKYAALSEREIEVVRLICKEYTNREIADEFCLSPRTIDTYRESILRKTKAKNTAGIVMYAIKHNLLDS